MRWSSALVAVVCAGCGAPFSVATEAERLAPPDAAPGLEAGTSEAATEAAQGAETGLSADAEAEVSVEAAVDATPEGSPEAGPEASAEVGPPPVCTPGTSQCVDDLTVETCSPSGQWTTSPCPHACVGGSCGGVCTPGSFQFCFANGCGAQGEETCGDDGQWSACSASC